MTWPTRNPRRKKVIARDPVTRRILQPSEHVIQVRLLNALELVKAKGVYVFAVPNQSNRGAVSGMKMKAEGVRSGVTDLVVMMPGGRTAFLEMKKPGGRLSDTQKQFRDRCLMTDHLWAVAYSVTEALVYLRSWGALREGVTDLMEAAE